MGPWSPSVYGKQESPSNYATRSTSQQQNPFEMGYNSHERQPAPSSAWEGYAPPLRKRALSSPALLWEGSANARTSGSYFDQHPSGGYQYSHAQAHGINQDLAMHPSLAHNSSQQQLQTHPAMHESIQAISALATFNQAPPTTQQVQPTRHSARAPHPVVYADAVAEPAPRTTKRQRKADSQQPVSASPPAPAHDDRDELEDDANGHSGEGADAGGLVNGMDAEAQRKDLLDRNRIAARKSREKRKREVQALETSRSMFL